MQDRQYFVAFALQYNKDLSACNLENSLFLVRKACTTDSLYSQIREVAPILNGRVKNNEKATFSVQFKPTRYAITLWAALNLFSEQATQIERSSYFGFYGLKKIADVLEIDYDRTKQAQKTYRILEAKGFVNITRKDNKTYITLTKKGVAFCKSKLRFLREMKQALEQKPYLQENYSVEREKRKEEKIREIKKRMKEGHEEQVILTGEDASLLFSEPDEFLDAVERLIEKISNWD